MMDLLTMVMNELPIYCPPVPDPMVWKQDAFQYPGPPSNIHLPSICCNTGSHKQGVDSLIPLHGSRGLTLATQGVVPGPSSTAGGRAADNMGPPGTAPCQAASSGARDDQASNLKVVQQLGRKAGFSGEFAIEVAPHVRKSYACLYQAVLNLLPLVTWQAHLTKQG